MSRNWRSNVDRQSIQQQHDHDRWREGDGRFGRRDGHSNGGPLSSLYPREYPNDVPRYGYEEPVRDFIAEHHHHPNHDTRSLDVRADSVFTRLDQQANDNSHHVMERLGPSSADVFFNKQYPIHDPPGGGHPVPRPLFHSSEGGSAQNSFVVPRPQPNHHHSLFPPSQSLPPQSLSPPAHRDLMYNNNNNNYPNRFSDNRYINADPVPRQSSSSVHHSNQPFNQPFNRHGYEEHRHFDLSDRTEYAPIQDRRPLFTPPGDRRPLFTPPGDRSHTPTQSSPLAPSLFDNRRRRSPPSLSSLAHTSNDVQQWSPSRLRRSPSPRRRSLSPQRSPRRSLSPRRSPRRSLSPRRSSRRSLSPRRSPRRSLSPRRSPRRSLSPRRRSPMRYSSPRKPLRSFSPRRSPQRSLSPQRRSRRRSSPRRRSPRRSLSPQRFPRRSFSPQRFQRVSPQRSSPGRSLSPQRRSRSSPMAGSPPSSPLGRVPSSPLRVSPPLRHHSKPYNHASVDMNYTTLKRKESPVKSYQPHSLKIANQGPRKSPSATTRHHKDSERGSSSDRMPANRTLKILSSPPSGNKSIQSSPIPVRSKHKSSSPNHLNNTSVTPRESVTTTDINFEKQHLKSPIHSNRNSAFVSTAHNRSNPSVIGNQNTITDTSTSHHPHEVSTSEDHSPVNEGFPSIDYSNTLLECSMENRQRLESVTQWIQSAVIGGTTYSVKVNDDNSNSGSVPIFSGYEDLQNRKGTDVQNERLDILESAFENRESVCSTPELRIDCSANVDESVSEEYGSCTARAVITEEKGEGISIVPQSTRVSGGVVKEVNNSDDNMEHKDDVENESFGGILEGETEGKGMASEHTDCKTICNDVLNKTALDESEEKRQDAVLNEQLMVDTLLEYVDRPNTEVNKCSSKDNSISTSKSNKERPESPESGEIIESEEEKEEGEIEDPSEEKESLHKMDDIPKSSSNEMAKSRDGARFFKHHYQSCVSPSKYSNKPRDLTDRRLHNSGRRQYYKSMRYHQSDERWKRRRRSSPPLPPAVVVDDEKELLLLRTAALETMIVRPKHSPEQDDSTELKVSQEDKMDEHPDQLPDQQQEIMMVIEDEGSQEVVDMDLVTSDSSSTASVVSLTRDNTPEVTIVPPSQPLATTDTTNKPFKPAGTNSASVKVVTNKNDTWKIQNFSIVTSDTEDDENGDDPCQSEINDVIQLYREVAEAKVTGTGRSLSSLNMELKEYEDEMEEEEMKMELLEQQMQASRQKITKLREQKREMEMKIAIVNKLTNPLKVPTISVVAPPTSISSPYSNTPSPTPVLSKLDQSGDDVIPTDGGSMSRVSSISSIATANDDQTTPVNLSRPSSLRNSPSPSCDQRLDSNIGTKVLSPSNAEIPSSVKSSTTVTAGVPTSGTSATGKGTKQKQLINLVTARQNNLAQVKGLLEMIENNQRKRKKSPNMTQSIAKKIHQAKHSAANQKNVKQHKKESAGSSDTVSTVKPKVSSQLTKSSKQASHRSKSSLVSKNVPITTSKPSCSSSTHSEEPKLADLELVLKQLNIDCLEEAKLKKWFDHMTSSNVSSSIDMPRPLCPLTPACMAVNHFQREKTTISNQEMATSSLRKILLKPSQLTPVIKGSTPSLLPYESPLLKFRSYRLCPLYRTLFKKPLSSLTHSNTIRPNVIMCHHESQGQCMDKACKAQHFANVAMTHDDIINDLTRYLPPDKEASIREKLSKFSKLEADQLQTMAAHLISQELSHDDHMTISNQWLENASETPPAPPSSTKTNLLPSLEPINSMLDTLPTVQSSTLDSGCTRYFLTDTDDEITPTTLIKKARDSDGDDKTYEIIEDGLESFPDNELLWLEYFRIAQKLKKLSNDHFNRAVSSAPSYRIYYEIIKLSVDKAKWILIALKYFINAEEQSDTVSHTILELILSYCTWYMVMFSNGVEIALDFLLNFTEDISESLILQRLCRDDKVFLGLIHLQLLYTGKMPVAVSGCHGSPVPVRITSNKHYLIPFTSTKKISQDLFDDMMNLFHRYLKKMADPSYNVSINIANCLPLYINLFYFEMSQGNSRTTAISVSRLLTTVPGIRELLVMRSFLEPSSAQLTEGGGVIDPLVYYILARNSLLQEESSDNAVLLLTKCVHNYFTMSDEGEDQFDTFILYRKLLGYQVPYDIELPPLRNIDFDRSSLCLNYCLLVELTTPTLCNEVYEVSLHYGDLVWLQFVSFLSHQFKTAPTLKNATQLLNVCQRFSLAIPLSSPYLCQIKGAESHYSDHTLHDQMLDMLLECTGSTEDKALLLRHVPMYYSPYWIYRFYQFSECLEQVRAVLAQYLMKFPCHLDMWLMGISIEMRLGNFRQARWMFTKAIHFIPYSSKLWTQFVMFELAGIVKHYSTPTLLQTIVNKVNLYGIEINHPF